MSVTTPIHSLTRCLHAHRARQDAIGPRSDCSSWSRPGRRNCHSHCRPSSSLPVRRCAYCRSVALRLRTSRKSRQQIKAKWRSVCLLQLSLNCLRLSSATNEKQRFNNFALEILFERISCQAISGHICVTSVAIEPKREISLFAMRYSW